MLLQRSQSVISMIRKGRLKVCSDGLLSMYKQTLSVCFEEK